MNRKVRKFVPGSYIENLLNAFSMEKELNGPIKFQSSKQELSLGVELELQVLEKDSLLLTPKASTIIDLCDTDNIVPEFFQSTLEIVSGICQSVHEVQADLRTSINSAYVKANQTNLKLGSTGTHPLADYRDRLVTSSARYHELIDRNQWLIRRMAVYGMHIHLGMSSGDSCIRYNYFFMHLLPHILALSGSSPFWQGMYTGLSSCRPTMYEALPTAGMPYLVKNWYDFQKLYSFLQKSKAIETMKDLWWDLRPSPLHGTLELRFCDEPATLKEALGIVAFVHGLAHWFHDHEEEWNLSHTPLKHWIFRENKWRAIRYGLGAEIVVTRNGKTSLLKNDVEVWLKKIEPYVTSLKYESHISVVREILDKGNSSSRQHRVFELTNDLREVVRHNVNEFESGEPLWKC